MLDSGLKPRNTTFTVLPGGTAGVWGRSLCINDGTLSGSMFEAIARAKSRGWAVVVADPHGGVFDFNVAVFFSPHL